MRFITRKYLSLGLAKRSVGRSCAALLAIAVTACGGGGTTDSSAPAAAARSATSALAVAATSAAPAVWTTVATEGQSYQVDGTQTVRYGAGDTWITQQVTGGGACSNAAFGNDPAFGTVKSCQIAAADVAGWTTVASEGAAFSVDGTQTVRYGNGSSWVTKTVAGSGVCSNDFFGSDPLFGTVKACQVATGAATAPPVATAGACQVPAAAPDTSASVATVGDGTPGSCTESALRAAVAAYPVVKFNCGSAPTTIPIATTIEVPPQRDTVIDGGGNITLDGQGRTRILDIAQANYRTNTHGLTLQHIALINGHAPGGGYVAPDPNHPACASGYASGSGGAVYAGDAKLYLFDVDFRNNAAATPGPDVGGGAVYAAGSLDVLIAGSRFDGNTGANSGAVGMLNSNLRVYNSRFSGNSATGTGQNYQNADVASCPGVGQPGQGGSGGNAGAIGIDGGDDTDVTVCGSTFSGNHANELAGALARTADISPRALTIDRSTFDNNQAHQGGAFYLHNAAPLTVTASTFSNNRAVAFGAGQLDQSTFTIVNSTFAANQASQGVGGALVFGGTGNGSRLLNVTFAGNRANGGTGYFSAAIFGDSNVQVDNTVFANNTTDDPYNPMQCEFSPLGGSADLQWPLQHSAAGGGADSPCVGGIVFADPLLGPLAANGGPTQTLAPAATSPLRGAGRQCPTTDQSGRPRDPAHCTIGAVE